MNNDDRHECQVCERHQKTKKNGTLVNHGYQRPGWGHIVGNCFGVGHLPFPNTSALLLWQDAVAKIKDTTAAKVRTVEAGEHDKVALRIWKKNAIPKRGWGMVSGYVTEWKTREELEAYRESLGIGQRSGVSSWEVYSDRLLASRKAELRNAIAEQKRVADRIKKANAIKEAS